MISLTGAGILEDTVANPPNMVRVCALRRIPSSELVGSPVDTRICVNYPLPLGNTFNIVNE
jgi:hypothetical protein